MLQDIEAEDISNVYITTYGDRYHIVKSCPGLKRDIRRVKNQKLETFLHVVNVGQNIYWINMMCLKQRKTCGIVVKRLYGTSQKEHRMFLEQVLRSG